MSKLSDLLSPLPLTDEEKTRQPVRAWQYKAPRFIVRFILLPIALIVIGGVILILIGCQAADNGADRGNRGQWEEGYEAHREKYRLGCAARNTSGLWETHDAFVELAFEKLLSDADFAAGWNQSAEDDEASYSLADLMNCEEY